MPVQYRSIVDEHHAARRHAALFDVSHMGRFELRGGGAQPFLERLLSRRVHDLPAGRIRYSLVTQHEGGILDDVLVYHLTDVRGAALWWLVVNASNRAKIWQWLQAHRQSEDVELVDHTLQTAMVAVQGPEAVAVAAQVLDRPLDRLRYYRGECLVWRGEPVLLSRTGYTGEDGVEVTVPSWLARPLWEVLLSAGAPTAAAAGLGARDTLRLEAGLPLYGHELSEQTDPFQAGLRFAVDLAGRQFPGHHRLQQIAAQPPARLRVGLVSEGRRAARAGYTVMHAGHPVGQITSGTFSPTLDRPIAMGYVQGSLATPGTELEVDLRGRKLPAVVTPLPLYRRGQ